MSKIALRIKIVDRRQQAGNPDIILLVTIAITGFAIPIGNKCERKGVFCLIIGWQFFLKVLKPFIKPAVGADFAGMMKYLQIIVVLVNVLQMKGLCIISQYPLMPACVSRMVRYGLFSIRHC